MDCSLPGSIHGIFQARVLEWIAISFSRQSSRPRYQTRVSSIKKAEHRRIDAFKLWCWRRRLRVPCSTRRSNQSLLKEISPECSLEGLMLKLKLLILWAPDSKNWFIGKDPDAGKDWRQEKGMTGRDSWMASPTWSTWVWVDSQSWWWTGRPGVLQSMRSQRIGHDWAAELNWGFFFKKICQVRRPENKTQIWKGLG